MNQSQVSGGFWGLLVGDALGVPYEFKVPHQIPPRAQIEFDPPSSYHRTYAGVAPGTWSDDGACALALLDSLLTRGKLDLTDLATRLSSWQENGDYAVDGNVFDIGITTSQALSNFRAGQPAKKAGLSSQTSNGNGSLMRVLPLALWHRGSDEELARDAMMQSKVTHAHIRSQVCCALYCLWARGLAAEANSEDAWKRATATLRPLLANTPAEEELEMHIRPEDEAPGQGSGYVVDSLRSARHLLAQEISYEQIVKGAVALGSDTDTTACIAGGVAGIKFSVEAIPARWMNSLLGSEISAPLLERLLQVENPIQ